MQLIGWRKVLLALGITLGMALMGIRVVAACGDDGTNRTICVDADATGAATGLSWTDAYTNVQDALAVAAPDDEIWVAEGVYYPDVGSGQTNNAPASTFTLRSRVRLYGGFAATETLLTQRDWTAHVNVLSGDIDGNDWNTDTNRIAETWNDLVGANAIHVVNGGGVVETARLDGFTVTAGYANGGATNDHGGGMFTNGHPTLTNVTFSGNQANGHGGGMYNRYSNPRLTNVTFSGNQADHQGGGMYNLYSNPTLTHVIFSGNQSNFRGGGMFNENGSPTLTHVTFNGNRATNFGGGMDNFYGSPTLTNVTFSGNQASESGGGMGNHQLGNPTLTNVTFSGNQANTSGGGMYNYNSSSTLVNCILWGNNAPTGPEIYNDSGNSPIITYSDIQGWSGGGTGNLNADPQFVAPVAASSAPTTTGNYRLREASPAINAGNNLSVIVTTDLDGNPRIVGGAVDMGAYETQPSEFNLTKTVTPTLAAHHGPVTYTLVLNNTGPGAGTVWLTDTLPADVTFAHWLAHPGATRVGDVLTWTGTLTPSTALTFTFVATHTSDYGAVVTNTAAFSGVYQTGSASATFTVEPNYPPVLAAIGDQTVAELSTVTLTATATDANVNDTLTFTLATGSVGSITDGGVFTWTPTEAQGPGVFTATVRVSDGNLSDSETFSITVNEINTAPVLAPLADQTIMLGATVSFTATAADTDLPANPLTFTLGPGSVGSITVSGDFTWTPTAAGVYTAAIRVSDGELSDAAIITITVTEEPVYTLRIATAGDGQGTVTPGLGVHEYLSGATALVTATAQADSDFAGWTGACSGAAPTCTVWMDSDKVVTATFALKAGNHAPVANAGADQTVGPGASVTLDGSASSDPDGNWPLTYFWQQTGGPAVSFTPTVSRTTFSAPETATVLTFTLVVTDNLGLAAPTPDTVVITVEPHALYLPLVLRNP